MTTPTTNLTMSSIQTEFGGANPINLSEYYRGGTYVPSGTATSATDGVAISTSGTIRMGMFRGVSVPVSGAVRASGSGIWYLSNTVSDGSSTVTINFLTDGGVTYTGNESTGPSTWFTPTSTGIGSSYWIRATVSGSGGSFSGTTGSWLALSTARSWSLNTFGAGNTTATRTLSLSIATDSAGTNIVANYTGITMYVYEGILA